MENEQQQEKIEEKEISPLQKDFDLDLLSKKGDKNLTEKLPQNNPDCRKDKGDSL